MLLLKSVPCVEFLPPVCRTDQKERNHASNLWHTLDRRLGEEVTQKKLGGGDTWVDMCWGEHYNGGNANSLELNFMKCIFTWVLSDVLS